MRYLEALPEGQQVSKVILVAGLQINLGSKSWKTCFQTDIDFSKIKVKFKRRLCCNPIR